MKKLLLFTLLTGATGLYAQSKATAAVSLTAGMTAKLELNSDTSIATLTLTGPSDRWFALQLGSFTNQGGMAEGMDVVYWDGTTLVDAVQLGLGSPPTVDTNDWTSTSTVAGTTRTVVATRAFDTGSADDYTFVYDNTDIDFAWAKAASATNTMSFHGTNRGYDLNNTFSEVLSTPTFSLKNLVVYPNPVQNILTVSYSEAITNISIINMLGQTVISKNANTDKVEIDTSGLQNGSYVLKVSTADGEASMKVIK